MSTVLPPVALTTGFDPMIAFSAFMTQVGARHITFNFTDAQKKLFAHPLTQQVVLFAMFYFSTRRLLVAISLLVIYNLATRILLNEQHPLNILSRDWLNREGFTEQSQKSSVDLYYENIAKLNQ
jgi:hypothetical protein